jgi:mannitol-1-/sugar-/sorbitol-6-phosphatase
MPSRTLLACDAVLFDLDGVLIDSTAVVERHYRMFALRHGLDADALIADLHGRRMADVIAAALPGLRGQELADECARFEAAEAADVADLAVIPGAAELTHELEGRPWAIVTSGTGPVATRRLEAAGIAVPPVLITGELVASGKPSPDPYLLAAERLGVDPARCVVVEDAPAGVDAGLAAGASVIGVATTVGAEELSAAHHVVDVLTRLSTATGTDGAWSIAIAQGDG